uniref:Retinol dehydrogenase 7 n=1 Tax=Ascaris suum TaxID=6253 RepID=F1LAU3_ASCSU
MTVFATCLTAEGCQRLLTRSSGLAGQLDCFVMDVRSEESVTAALNHLKRTTTVIHKGLYGLVNNAGVSGVPLPDDLLTLDDYRRVIDVNAFGVIRVTHAFKELIKEQRGRIIVVTSVCSRIAIPMLGPYSVSKFAVDAYCDILRRELSVFGVNVCAIEPGFFSTPMVNMDNIEEKLHIVWENISDGLKQQYGKKYLNYLIDYMREFLRGICSSHTEWVVDAHFHALTSRYPRVRYRIGIDALLWLFFFRFYYYALNTIIFQ